jgi:hypothetical protein
MWWPPKRKKRGKERRKRGSNMSLVGDVYCHHNKIIELFERKEGVSITAK